MSASAAGRPADPVLSVTHFGDVRADFADRARAALDAFAARPGYLRGSVSRSVDDPAAWVLITEWVNVGSYRRALGAFDVRVRGAALMADALDLPSTFEVLLARDASGVTTTRGSDREPAG